MIFGGKLIPPYIESGPKNCIWDILGSFEMLRKFCEGQNFLADPDIFMIFSSRSKRQAH